MKNGTPRIVPLSDEAVAILIKRRPSEPEEFVFSGSSNQDI
jgi:integrase